MHQASLPERAWNKTQETGLAGVGGSVYPYTPYEYYGLPYNTVFQATDSPRFLLFPSPPDGHHKNAANSSLCR